MDETLLITTRHLQGTNQPKVQLWQRAKIVLESIVPTKHIFGTVDIKVTLKPGDGGWIRSSVALSGDLCRNYTTLFTNSRLAAHLPRCTAANARWLGQEEISRSAGCTDIIHTSKYSVNF